MKFDIQYRYFLLCFLSIIFFHERCIGQDCRVTTYQVENGLPNPLTKTVIQDDMGFVWTGTDLGLVKFDGKHYTLYDKALPSIFVKGFLKKRNGDLLVIHDLGISKIVHTQDTLYFPTVLNGERDITDTTVMFPKSAFEARDGGVWTSEYKTVVLYKDEKIKRYYFDPKSRTNSFNRSYHFIEDHHGTIWVISQQGYIFYLDEQKDEFVEVENLVRELGSVSWVLQKKDKKMWLAATTGIFEFNVKAKHQLELIQVADIANVSCMAENSLGDIFLGTWFKGLHVGRFENGKLITKPLPKLEHKVINYLYVNENDDLWSSSDEGIALIQPTFFSKLPLDIERDFMLGIYPGEKNRLYATSGGGIIEISSDQKPFLGKTIIDIPSNEIIKHVIHHDGVLYFGSNKEYLYWLENGKLNKLHIDVGSSILNITPDTKGNLWICFYEIHVIVKVTPDKKVIKYDASKGIEASLLVCRVDEKGKVYAAGRGENHYLYQYNEQNDVFENISLPLGIAKNDFGVEDIAITPQGNIWLASNFGVLEYDNQKRAVTKLDHSVLNGIDVVKALVLSKAGELWIGTDMGLFRYYKGQVLLFDDFNGLPSKVIASRALVIDEENRLWAGTAAGIGFAHGRLSSLKMTPTPVFLSLEMKGETVGIKQTNFVGQSFLQARFIATTYPANNVIYQYRLKGQNEGWVNLGHRQDILIPEIPVGNYALEVRALQQGEFVWSKPLVFEFSIKVPWYLSWWAYLIYVFGFIGLIVLLVKLNTRRLFMEKVRLEKTVMERTVQLEERNAKILSQKEEIEAQRDKLMVLNEELVEQKNKTEVKSRALEEALLEISTQKQELEKLNATKDKFFSIVAHDLRGPLNSLSNFAELLINYNEALSPEEIRKVAVDLQKSVKNTFQLTENLLSWARAQMDNLTFEPACVDISELINTCMEVLQTSADAKNIRIEKDFHAEAEVWSDKDQLTFIVRNLLSNAIKFTKNEGLIAIQTKVVENLVEICVVDTGVGMEQDIADKIFDIGFKFSTLGTCGEKGTGLGLMLTKEFLQKNGGQIKVISQPGKGSKFIITMPIAAKKTLRA
jgi:signal transduction histidine kinase/ligand-binding sensor domain-containing protein